MIFREFVERRSAERKIIDNCLQISKKTKIFDSQKNKIVDTQKFVERVLWRKNIVDSCLQILDMFFVD